MPGLIRPSRDEFRALLWSQRTRSAATPDPDAVRRFQEIAADWSAKGQHFYAGHALWTAVDSAWGDGDAVGECAAGAAREFGAAAECAAATDRLAGLRMWITATGMNYARIDPSAVRISLQSLYEELGQ